MSGITTMEQAAGFLCDKTALSRKTAKKVVGILGEVLDVEGVLRIGMRIADACAVTDLAPLAMATVYVQKYQELKDK